MPNKQTAATAATKSTRATLEEEKRIPATTQAEDAGKTPMGTSMIRKDTRTSGIPMITEN
eukprot:13941820-Ditylum_brightwellii.AAC.1